MKGQTTISTRAPATHEVFVGEVGVELNDTQLRLLRFIANKGHAEAFGQPGFAGAGRALEDQVLLLAETPQDAFEFFSGQEAAFGQDVVDSVGNDRLDGFHACGLIRASGLLFFIRTRWQDRLAGVVPSFKA